MSESKAPNQPEPSSSTIIEGDEAYCAACNQSFPLDQLFCPTDGAKLVKLRSTPDQLLGRVFDHRYELRSVLSQGGMGTVYRAWQMSVDREVAIKVIHPKLAAVRAVAKRFLREARLASRLNQPNIVNVYDFGQSDDGVLYLVMELLRGRPLSDEIQGGRALPVRRILTIAAQICDALDAAHNQGIVHRDLKPQNIVILDDPPGRDLLKVLDFGLAKSLLYDTTSLVTQTDALLGTPRYMPPEQISGKPPDQRADLYSLGCILYHMACGQPPFSADNMNTVLAMHLHHSPPPLPDAVPPALATLIARLMMKAPEDRPATARIVHSAIAALAGDTSSPVLAPPPSNEPLPRLPSYDEFVASPIQARNASVPPQRRRRTIQALAFAVTIAAGIFAAALLSSRLRANSRVATAPADATGALPRDGSVRDDAAPKSQAVAAPRGDGNGVSHADTAPLHAGAAPNLDATPAPPADAAPHGAPTASPADASPRVDAQLEPGRREPGRNDLRTRTTNGTKRTSPAPDSRQKIRKPDPDVTREPRTPDAGLPDIDLLPTRP